MRFFRLSLLLLLFPAFSEKLFAAHFYGVDLFYSHVVDSTYKVTMVAYGDCSGSTFPSFRRDRPLIYVLKGDALIDSGYLEHEPPKDGIEVTPVCPNEVNSTTCVNTAGTVPGVMKFVYSKDFTLRGHAPNWKFVFLGTTDGSTPAGRSITLTNLTNAGLINLEATLDNTQYSNSSPEYTTIATPFYCVNTSTKFNPGAVDADGDSLLYELVPGLAGGAAIPYAVGFSGDHPIAVASGNFNFSPVTGQLNFTTNQLQKSLVVYKVSEYRNSILIGTSMREMTVIVLDCGNNPPIGYISNAVGATIIDSVTVETCKGDHKITFDIKPSDADGHTISMTPNGLPQYSTLNITDNNTKHPVGRFMWDAPELKEGDYTFFVTYTDDGCRIASKQTQAYTIRIGPEKIIPEVTLADCSGKGTAKVTAPSGWVPWDYKIYEGSTVVYNRENIFRSKDSSRVDPGKYRIEAINYLGCRADTTAEIVFDCYMADLPTAFSPNSDGYNDMLYVRGGGIQEMYLRIYNRWGQLVFESRDLNMGWDGKYKGADAPAEAYGYVLSAILLNNKTFQKQGNITLIR